MLVIGARQVGKTYLIEELFAKKYYKNSYLRIDCSDDNEFVDYVFNYKKDAYELIKDSFNNKRDINNDLHE